MKDFNKFMKDMEEKKRAEIANLLNRYENDNAMLLYIKQFITEKTQSSFRNRRIEEFKRKISEGKENSIAIGEYKLASSRHYPKHENQNTQKKFDYQYLVPKKSLYVIGAYIEAKNGHYCVLAPKFIFLDKEKAISKLNELLENNESQVILYTVKEGEEIHPISL